jgi:hypothetical protein
LIKVFGQALFNVSLVLSNNALTSLSMIVQKKWCGWPITGKLFLKDCPPGFL